MIYLAFIAASLHYLALALGLGAVFLRGRCFLALQDSWTPENLKKLFAADNVWGLAALLWLGTGLARAFGGLEKGAGYYLGSALFWAKMGLFLLILLLEIKPMVTLIRWRIAQKRGGLAPSPEALRGMARVSFVEAGLVVAMVFVASAMARGLGFEFPKFGGF